MVELIPSGVFVILAELFLVLAICLLKIDFLLILRRDGTQRRERRFEVTKRSILISFGFTFFALTLLPVDPEMGLQEK